MIAVVARLRASLSILALVGIALASCGPPEPARTDAAGVAGGEPAADRPNVIVVVMDTTRADRCSFLGYERPTTPNLERLAATGTAFSACWSPAPWTGPSHASLFTGLRPENHGYLRENRTYLAPTAVTLAERLAAAGYRTMGISNNPNVTHLNGLDQGFEEWRELFRAEVTTLPDVRAAGIEHELPGSLEVVTFPSAAVGHDEAAAWVLARHAAEEPYLLFVNDMEPHLPYGPDEDLQALFVPDGTPAADVTWARLFAYPLFMGHNLGVYEIAPERIALLSHLYDAEIATLDRHLGAFLDRLRAAGALDNTVVIVTADHGENLGEHGLLDHIFSSHRTLLNVPLLVVLPERLRAKLSAGTRLDDLVRLEDLTPTILDLCGLKPLERTDGASLLRDLPGRRSFAAVDRVGDSMLGDLREHFPGANLGPALLGQRSFTDGALHYIRHRNGREELFDLVVDPREQNDLAAEGGELLVRARKALDEVHPSRSR